MKKKRREELIVEFEELNPRLHAGRFETEFYDENFGHYIMTNLDWKGKGKAKITIEEL